MSSDQKGRSIRQTFFVLAALNFLSNITVPLTGLVDRGMLGHLDDLMFLDGVALAAIIFDYAYWSFGFLRMGTTGIVAQAHGRQDQRLIWNTLYRGLVMAVCIGSVLLLLQKPIVELAFLLLGGSEGMQEAGRAYFYARIWGAPATLANYVILGFLLGQSRSGVVLILTVIANLTNVLLNYLFIIEMNMAAEGAGMATMLSQYAMFAAALLTIFGQHPRAPVWAEVLQRDALWKLVSLNSDIMVRTLFLMTAFAIFNQFGARLGKEVLATNSLLFGLFLFAAFAVDGIAYAVESMAGKYWAQGDMERFRETLRTALSWSLVVGLLACLPMMLFRRPVMSLLTHHVEVIEAGAQLMPWLLAVVLFGSMAFVFDGLFISLSRGREMRNTMIFSFSLGFMPLALLALYWEQNTMLWAALVAFMFLRSSSQAWITWRRLLYSEAESCGDQASMS